MGTVWKICQSARQEYRMNWIFLSVALVCASAIELEDIANVRKGSEGTELRKPKLFFVSSASTTTTITTETTCYYTAAAPATITTCKRKRKRAIMSDAWDHKEFEPTQVESGLEDDNSEERQGKFLLYWLTTTTTSTTTAFTKTVSLGSVLCTPNGASLC